MNDKIIFLDIDGPVLPYRCVHMPGQTGIMTVFDPVAVSLLNELCAQYGWRIVIHSSWLRVMGPQETHEHCIKQGIDPKHFHDDAVCDHKINWRYTRVAKWLKEHPDVKTYVILDDEDYSADIYEEDYPHPADMPDHLIQVDYYNGLMFGHFDEIRDRGLGC